MLDEMTKEYRKKADRDRQLLKAMNIFNTIGMSIIIVNILIGWMS